MYTTEEGEWKKKKRILGYEENWIPCDKTEKKIIKKVLAVPRLGGPGNSKCFEEKNTRPIIDL